MVKEEVEKYKTSLDKNRTKYKIVSEETQSDSNIVDQIFIANASYLGSYGNAANTVVFPLTVIALAIAVMIGDECFAVTKLTEELMDEICGEC